MSALRWAVTIVIGLWGVSLFGTFVLILAATAIDHRNRHRYQPYSHSWELCGDAWLHDLGCWCGWYSPATQRTEAE